MDGVSANQARPLEGAVTLITGAGGAIGGASAKMLAKAGSSVFLVDANRQAADDVAAMIRVAGGRAAIGVADISSADEVDRVVSTAIAEFGRLDILVNNAAISPVTPFLEVSIEEWRRVFSVNVDGPLMLTLRCAQEMMKQDVSAMTGCRGKIINISSGAADAGRPMLAAYGATKAALNHLTMTASRALAEYEIASTVVYPGEVEEGLLGQVAAKMAASEGAADATGFLRQRAKARIDGRFSTPDEVAKFVAFAASTQGMRLNGRRVWAFAPEDALGS